MVRLIWSHIVTLCFYLLQAQVLSMNFRVAVPLDAYDQLIQYDNSTGNAAFQGPMKEVFDLAFQQVLNQSSKYQGSNYTLYPWNPSPHPLERNIICEEVSSGAYDIAIGDLSITERRLNYTTFTVPFQSASLVVVTKAVVRGNVPSNAFILPFEGQLWGLFAGLVGVMVLLLVWFQLSPALVRDRKFDKKSLLSAIGHGFLWVHHSLLYAHDNQSLKKGSASRLGLAVGAIWLFLVLIVFTAYQAKLTALFTASSLQPTIQTVQAAMAGSDKIGIVKGAWYQDLVTDRYIKAQTVNLSRDLDEWHEKLQSNTIDAILAEFPYASLFIAKHDCNQYVIAGLESQVGRYSWGGWGWAVHNNFSDFARELSVAISHLQVKGSLYDWQKKWLIEDDTCKPTQLVARMSISDFRVPLSLSFGAIGILTVFSCILPFRRPKETSSSEQTAAEDDLKSMHEILERMQSRLESRLSMENSSRQHQAAVHVVNSDV